MRSVGLLLTTLVVVAGCVSSDVSRSLGARCDRSADCDDRCLQPGTDYPGGFCTLSCESDSDCVDGARCISDQGGVCLFACDAAAGCTFLGPEWSCQANSGQGSAGQVMVCRGA